MKYCFGVDIGGTTVKLGLFTTDGEIVDKWEIKTRTENQGEAVLPDIAEALREKLEEKKIGRDEVEGIGVGVPAPVNTEGVVQNTANLGWGYKEVKREMEELSGMRAEIGNDANVAALGEMWLGAGKGRKNIVMVTLGTGVGGGIIIDGKPLVGAHGAGGEIGHLCVNYDDEETVKMIGKAFLEEKPLTVRFDEHKIKKAELIAILEKEGVTAGEVPEIPCALYLSGYDHLSALPSFCEGLYQVQDLSSMQVALWSEVKAGDQVLDVCAAPGGKAIHIAELLNGTGHVEARDLTEYKVALIRDNIERSGLTNINAVCQDAAIYDPHKKETADIVIADLPCSGLGVLGKKPDLRYKMNEKTEADLVELQKKILSVVKDYVKPGGKLLYSTCTIHREENEGNVEWFLKEYSEFELVKEKQMIPGRDAGDGFYIAILKRVNHE